MSKDNDHLWKVLKHLPSDYTDYGGEVKRWEKSDEAYPDCSGDCLFFVPLAGNLGFDWGVCANPDAPRAGLLTWEHQAGYKCFVDRPRRGGYRHGKRRED